jgi:glycosyltransferase involved in cell wall biosynthesis
MTVNVSSTEFFEIPGGVSRDNPILVAVYGLYPELYRENFRQLFNSRPDFGVELGKPFLRLNEYCERNGIALMPLEEIHESTQVDVLLVFDVPVRTTKRYADLIECERIAKILVLQECPIIHPPNWHAKNHEAFDIVLTWNRDLGSRRNYQYLPWTSAWACTNLGVESDLRPRKYFLANISSNKKSILPGELYSERVRAITFFSRTLGSKFVLYGHGWESEKFPCYRGVSQSKLKSLKESEFSLCFENFSNMNGYVTEKIFDSIVCGSIPIYLGAPDIADHIDTNAFVNAREFKSYQDILTYITKLSPTDISSIREAGISFLCSKNAYPYSTDYFIASVTSTIVRLFLAKKCLRPKITICIPTYNGSQYISECVASALEALNGNHGNVIVIDNASTDRTDECMRPFFDDPRFSYFKNRINIGSEGNHNLCILLAQGDLVKILHADDKLKPGHLNNGIRFFNEIVGISLYYSQIEKIGANGESLGVLQHVGQPKESGLSTRDETAALLQHDCYVTISAAIMRRDQAAQLGFFSTGFEGAGDWDFWVRLSREEGRFFFSKSPEVQYRVHPKQDSMRFYATSSHVDDHLRVLKKHLPDSITVLSKQELLNTFGLAYKKICSRPELALSRLPQLVNVFRSSGVPALQKKILNLIGLDEKVGVDSLQIDLDFAGGLGAQLLSLGIYLGLIASGIRVKANLKYFTLPAADYSTREDGLPTHWDWALKPYGYSIGAVQALSDSQSRVSNFSISIHDGILKSRLRNELSRFILNDRMIPDVVLNSDLESIREVKRLAGSTGYVALHLRRGDYRAVASHIVEDRTSVECALLVSSIANSIVVCSEEVPPPSVSERLRDRYQNVFFFDIQKLSQYGAVHIFRNSKVFVMSNSQLSYIGASLSRGLALSPRKWFGDEHRILNDLINDDSDFLLFKNLRM